MPLIFLILAVVSGLTLYVVKTQKEKKEKREEKEKRLFSIDSLDVVEIELDRREQGDKIVFKKVGEDEWMLTSPVEADADPFTPRSIARKIEEMESKRKFSKEELNDLEQFGLKEPEYTITVKLKDNTSLKLFVGKKAPLGYSAYVMKENDDSVYLVSASILNELGKKVVDYRNRKIMDFLTSDVSRLIVTRKNEEIVFEKDTEEKWMIKKPLNVRASKDEIEKFLSQIRGIKVEEFVDDNPSNLSAYGLDNPKITIKVERKEKGPLTLYLGNRFKKGKDELVYVKREDRKNVYAIKAEVYDTALKRAVDFREKKPISFYTWKVKNFTISTSTDTFLFDKDNENNWLLTYRDEKLKANKLKVENLLRDIRDIEVKEFVDDNPSSLKKYRLDSPEYILRIVSENETPLEVLFSSAGEKGVYFKRGDEPYVYLGDKNIVNLLKINKDEMIEKEEKKEEHEVEAE